MKVSFSGVTLSVSIALLCVREGEPQIEQSGAFGIGRSFGNTVFWMLDPDTWSPTQFSDTGMSG